MSTRLRNSGLVVAGIIAGLVVAPTTVQAAVNYFDETKLVSGTGTVNCPSGWRLTGGGLKTLPSNSYGSSTSREYVVTGSYPYSATSWRATGKQIYGTYSSTNGWRFSTLNYNPSVVAICTR